MVTDAPARRFLLVAAVLLLPFKASGAPSLTQPKSGPPSAWVEPLAAPTSGTPPKDEISGGTWYRLSDRQVRVTGGSREIFSHNTRQIVNDAGLDGASQIAVEFEPSYQSLTFHWMRVYRAGQWFDRLSVPRMRVIQREPELESQIFDGRLSAVTVMEDLRVGDIVDYAYTLSGANPVLGPMFSDSFSMDWTVAVQKVSFRLLWPKGRHLEIRNHGTRISPRSREVGAYTETIWERSDAIGAVDEGNLPADYDPWGWVQLSEYAGWGEVVTWGRKLFASVPTTLSPDLVGKVKEWKAQSSDRNEQALLATRFVQDEVRYVGFEMGEGSHRPSPPDVVFRRRFGDCKDKALLLSTLLTTLGFDAKPTLISTSSGSLLRDWLPTPLAFNHAVVVANDGARDIWIDATISGQGGDLHHLQFPSYGHGLVLGEGISDLTAVPVTAISEPTLIVKSAYTSRNFIDPTDLVVETRVSGRDADSMRADLLASSRADLGKGFTKFYAATYPAIRASGLPEAKDDRDANTLTVVERYSIPGFWTKAKSSTHRPSAEVYPLVLMDAVPNPVPAGRVMPMALSFPRKVREVTEVNLPEDWGIEPWVETVADASMRLQFKSSYAARRLNVSYDYETLRSAVPAIEIAAHRQLRQRLINRLGYGLGGAVPIPEGSVNWSAAILIGAVAPVALWASIWMLRKRSVYARSPLDPAMSGLHGGIAAVGFLVALLTPRHGLALYESRSVWFLADWLARTSPGEEMYQAAWAPYLFVDLLGNALSLCFGVVLLLLYFTRRRTFPRVLVWFLIFESVFLLLSALLARMLPDLRGTAFGFLWTTVWAIGPLAAFVPYLFLSDRARSTFIK